MTATKSLFTNKHLNGWSLWGLITGTISLSMFYSLSLYDTTDPQIISDMIQHSVRHAVPWLFIAFAASSLVYVFPNDLTKWIMRNRRIIGLCFAAGMAWQLLFILWMMIGAFDYYMAEAYSYYDLSEQIPGYLILFAMTFTSFKFGRSMLTSRQWRMLHKGGIYFLWGVLWTTYWFELFFYDDLYDEVQNIDYVYYWMGFAAWGIRIRAWTLKRRVKLKMENLTGTPAWLVSWGLIAFGGFLLLYGDSWSPVNPYVWDTFSLAGWATLFVPFLALVPIFAAAFVVSQNKG